MSNGINKMQINKMKAAFRRPDLLDLEHELTTLDKSTNTYIHTTLHKVSLNYKHYHRILGLVTQPHPHWYQAKALTSEYSLIMRINS